MTLKSLSRLVVLKNNVDYFMLPKHYYCNNLGLLPKEQHERILEYKTPNEGLIRSAEHGFFEAFLFFKELGADDFNVAMCAAASKGHYKIVKFCLEHGTTKYFDAAICDAARFGHIEVVKLLKDYCGVNDLNKATSSAAEGGHYEIVKLFISWGADFLGQALIVAAGKGDVDIVKLLVKHGANNFEGALNKAVDDNVIRLLNRLINRRNMRKSRRAGVIKIECPTPVRTWKIGLTTRSTMYNWKIEASNDDIAWTVLYSPNHTYLGPIYREFLVDSLIKYNFFRVNTETVNPGLMQLFCFELTSLK